MRVVVVSSLFVLIACGGSNKPAETAESPAEPNTSSSQDVPAASSESEGDAGPAFGTPTGAAAPSTPAPAAESPSTHPVPTSTGSVDGKPFIPKMARVTQPAAKDGRVVLTLDERTQCGGGDPKPGDSYLTVTVPWEDGYKQDLGSLKRAGKNGAGEISFVRVNTNGKKEPSATFKPTGRMTVVKAPSDEGAVGKLNIDMQSGDYMLSGDLDIQLCVAAKGGGGAGAAAAGAGAAPASKPPKAGKKKK
jgi:hypothetical protein